MQSIRKLLGFIILFSLLLASSGCDALPNTAGEGEALSASGVVETVNVTVAPEIGGRVVEIYVAEGDAVQEGDLLFRIDDELLQSQRQQALATLEAAQANLITTRTGLEMAEATLRTAEASVETGVANAEVASLSAQKALDDLHKMHGVARSEASRNVASTNRAVREAQYRLDNFTISTEQKDMTAMEAIEVMKERLDAAREAFEPYKHKSSSDSTRKDLREDLDEAQSDYDAAVRRLEYETELEGAQAVLDKALQDLEVLEAGPNPEDVAVLEASILAAETAPRQAEAAVEQAAVGLTMAQAQLEQTEKAVAQAQAMLDLIDVQIGKLSVVAAISGVIISRNIEPGEVIQPGASVMTVGQLDKLTITVYIPEDQYGQINLGEHAEVTVDSFPGMTFDAQVVYIADKAEFTPRNVQTAEGRRTTVFAVELSLENTDGRLKPGMPADVRFTGE